MSEAGRGNIALDEAAQRVNYLHPACDAIQDSTDVYQTLGWPKSLLLRWHLRCLNTNTIRSLLYRRNRWSRKSEGICMKTKFLIGWKVFAIVPLLAASACLRAATPGAETKLLPSDLFGFRHFGSAVAIDGDSAVVGVPLDPENGSSAGAAYVFVRTGSDWTQQAK